MNTLNQNDKTMDPISNVASKFVCLLEVSCWVVGLVSLDDRQNPYGYQRGWAGEAQLFGFLTSEDPEI